MQGFSPFTKHPPKPPKHVFAHAFLKPVLIPAPVLPNCVKDDMAYVVGDVYISVIWKGDAVPHGPVSPTSVRIGMV